MSEERGDGEGAGSQLLFRVEHKILEQRTNEKRGVCVVFLLDQSHAHFFPRGRTCKKGVGVLRDNEIKQEDGDTLIFRPKTVFYTRRLEVSWCQVDSDRRSSLRCEVSCCHVDYDRRSSLSQTSQR